MERSADSLFVYDTTLRVPLIVAGPGVLARTVGLARLPGGCRTDRAASAGKYTPFDSRRHRSRTGARRGRAAARGSDAESFAPLLDFGWSPLRALRVWQLQVHRGAASRVVRARRAIRARTGSSSERRPQVRRSSRPRRTATLARRSSPDACRRRNREGSALQALGYASGSNRGPGGARSQGSSGDRGTPLGDHLR